MSMSNIPIPTQKQRHANLVAVLRAQSQDLLEHTQSLMDAANMFYAANGRGALLFKFRDTEHLVRRQKSVLIMYVPLELSLELEYSALSQHVYGYNPLCEFVMLLCVSTSLVEGGEVMLVSTARSLLPPTPTLLEDVSGNVGGVDVPCMTMTSANAALSREFCAFCFVEQPRFQCSRCATMHYCSKACQRQHWRQTHKGTCGGGGSSAGGSSADKEAMLDIN